MPAKLPKKPVPKVEASSAPSTETGLEARRPAYIIVFRERSPANTKVLAAALDVNEAKGVAARDSRTILQHNHEWAVRPRVYERMGLAVADLDPSEIEELQKSDSVAAIVPNRERRVPPIIEHTDPEVAYSPVLEPGRIEPPVSLREPFVPPPGAEFAFAYASGIRDAAEMVLRAFRPSLPSSGLAAIAGSAAHSWCLNLIGIDEKYSRATGRGVRVAVLDTGIDLQHPDFQGRFIGGDGTVSFVPGETVQDGNGHGTHCAGVIGGAARPNGGRRYGVAPDAELLIGKVLSDAGRGHDDQIIEGIDWAADAGAQVISMSLGSPRSVEDPYSDPYEVVAANYLAMVPGTLIVAAAGNESARPSFTSPVGDPAACPSIMAVAAVDKLRRVAPFSCREMDPIGSLDISGPGVAVYSAWMAGGYRTISGTSMATPHVAAVAALFLEVNPELTAQQLWSRLLESVVSLGVREDFGAGLVQAPKAG